MDDTLLTKVLARLYPADDTGQRIYNPDGVRTMDVDTLVSDSAIPAGGTAATVNAAIGETTMYVIKLGDYYLMSDGNWTTHQRDALRVSSSYAYITMDIHNMRAVRLRPSARRQATQDADSCQQDA